MPWNGGAVIGQTVVEKSEKPGLAEDIALKDRKTVVPVETVGGR